MCTARSPTLDRRLRLERALAHAVRQERYTDAAKLRDALEALRTSDPVYSLRMALADAVIRQDFVTAARLRDELANLIAGLSKAGSNTRRVDRLIVLRGRADVRNVLRVSTVSRSGDLALPLNPDSEASFAFRKEPQSSSSIPTPHPEPRVYLQPTWSPSGDFIAMTEISFNIDASRIVRGIAVAEASSTLVIMDAFDGTVIRSIPLKKPPFFYYWSPDGQVLTLLSNDPSSKVTCVTLSAVQVVAPEGAQGLDLYSVTGPIVSGHPLHYDFCPRDSSRIVVHMADCATVAVVPISDRLRKRRVLTSTAGTFGAPQWHPQVGRDGREVVLFAEAEVCPTESTNVVEEKDSDTDKPNPLEQFFSTSSSLLESVLRKGARSLGRAAHKVGNAFAPEKVSRDAIIEEKVRQLEERLQELLPPNLEQVNDDVVSIIDLDDDVVQGPPEDASADLVKPMNRLVMCDVNCPEIRRTIAKFAGSMAFKLSPNGKGLAMLVTNPDSDNDEFTVCRGDFSPDSVVADGEECFKFGNPFNNDTFSEADVTLSTPTTKVIAFFWSPDSSKLLFLSKMRNSKTQAAQWATFDLKTSKVTRYEKFVMSGVYIHCLNFFDQFALSMTPWSPDSDAFCYPGRPLTSVELQQDEVSVSDPVPPASRFIQGVVGESKRFFARVQKVPDATVKSRSEDSEPEEAITILDNVEFTCWSPC